MESCTIASYSSEDVNKYSAPPPTRKKGKKRNHQFPTGTQVGTPVNKETDTENKIPKPCNLTKKEVLPLPTLPWGQLPTFRFISIPWRSRSSAPDPAHLRLLHRGQGPARLTGHTTFRPQLGGGVQNGSVSLPKNRCRFDSGGFECTQFNVLDQPKWITVTSGFLDCGTAE